MFSVPLSGGVVDIMKSVQGYALCRVMQRIALRGIITLSVIPRLSQGFIWLNVGSRWSRQSPESLAYELTMWAWWPHLSYHLPVFLSTCKYVSNAVQAVQFFILGPLLR